VVSSYSFFLWPPYLADTDITFLSCLWPPYVTGQAIIFLPFGFFFFLFIFLLQVWNVVHTARWKCNTQKIAKKSPSAHHRTTLSSYISSQPRHVSTIIKKIAKQQYLLHTFSQYGELRPTSGWDLLASLGHPCKFQRVSRLGSVTARHSSSGRQPNFAALNRRRHLYSAGRPSRWALVVGPRSSSFFLAYCQRSDIGCLPYFHTWCGLSANLECRSEMCSTRLAGNTGRKRDVKIAICAPSQNFVELYLRN